MAEGVTQEFKVIGTRPVRHDGVDKVTGAPSMALTMPFPRCCTARFCAVRMLTR